MLFAGAAAEAAQRPLGEHGVVVVLRHAELVLDVGVQVLDELVEVLDHGLQLLLLRHALHGFLLLLVALLQDAFLELGQVGKVQLLQELLVVEVHFLVEQLVEPLDFVGVGSQFLIYLSDHFLVHFLLIFDWDSKEMASFLQELLHVVVLNLSFIESVLEC